MVSSCLPRNLGERKDIAPLFDFILKPVNTLFHHEINVSLVKESFRESKCFMNMEIGRKLYNPSDRVQIQSDMLTGFITKFLILLQQYSYK